MRSLASHRQHVAIERPATFISVRRFGERDWRHILPAFLVLLSIFLPPEVRITIAGQTLYSYRIACLFLLPWVMFSVLRGQLKFYLPDYLIGAGAGWMVVSFMMNTSIAAGLASGVAAALDVLLPYFIVRLSVRSLRDFRRLLVMLAPIVVIVSVVMVLESLMHVRYIRDLGQAVFGPLGAAEFGAASGPIIASDVRFGLLRAMGPFSHPILAGLFLASLLPLFYFMRIKGWPLFAGLLSGLVSVFTASSAAVLAIAIFIATAIYEFVRRKVGFLNWYHFTASVIALLAFAQFATQNGIISVLVRFTLNPQSGRYRMLIWEYGTASVAQHPYFGIGYRAFESAWWMGDSIDAYWLALAIRFGILAPLCVFFAAMIIIFSASRKATRIGGLDRTAVIGMVVTLSILVICGFTVSFFGGTVTWFYALLAIGLNLSKAPFIGPKQRPVAAQMVLAR